MLVSDKGAAAAGQAYSHTKNVCQSVACGLDAAQESVTPVLLSFHKMLVRCHMLVAVVGPPAICIGLRLALNNPKDGCSLNIGYPHFG